jgi:hypothetical protein
MSEMFSSFVGDIDFTRATHDRAPCIYGDLSEPLSGPFRKAPP